MREEPCLLEPRTVALDAVSAELSWIVRMLGNEPDA